MFEKWAEKFQTRAEDNNVTFKNFDERAEALWQLSIEWFGFQQKHLRFLLMVQKQHLLLC